MDVSIIMIDKAASSISLGRSRNTGTYVVKDDANVEGGLVYEIWYKLYFVPGTVGLLLNLHKSETNNLRFEHILYTELQDYLVHLMQFNTTAFNKRITAY